ncbi:hypothetical protein FHR92_003677 [Fontibacillus solani]|uniref:Uncharacterized protein n=1 Tax=Fontibacillus solani TaxID=1572857 RepID=A0A7W3SVV0_9BACL|nr:hypothetical protein [Fontibacillus solani]MBA9087195.1 hypothetical protein [Fontibacillus solani]
MKQKTIRDFGDYSVDDILSVAEILKPAETQARIINHIQESREGWGSDPQPLHSNIVIATIILLLT